MIVLAGQPTTVNIQLTVASATQTVDVVEAATALQTENADVATGISTANDRQPAQPRRRSYLFRADRAGRGHEHAIAATAISPPAACLVLPTCSPSTA